MRHTSIAAIALLAAISTAGCVEVPGPYYRESVVYAHPRPEYAPYPYYQSAPAIVYIEPGRRHRHRHDRWRD